MAPRSTFPASGPDQTLALVIFLLGLAVGVLGYLTGSTTLRLAGIVMMFFATALLMADVLTMASPRS